MNQEIKPNCLCWIVAGEVPSWIGRVVTAVRRVEGSGISPFPTPVVAAFKGWQVEADWLPPTPMGWVCAPNILKPINDPDMVVEDVKNDCIDTPNVAGIDVARAT